MTTDEYKKYCADLMDDMALLMHELAYIRDHDRSKAASARARKQTLGLSKRYKDFRKVSVEFYKQ